MLGRARNFNARAIVHFIAAELKAEIEQKNREQYNSNMLYYIAMAQPWKNRKHLQPYSHISDEGITFRAVNKLSAEDILRMFKDEIREVLSHEII